jgi:hypothetical protein
LRDKLVSTARRVTYALIDALVFVVVWHVVVAKTGVQPPFSFMQRYSPADFAAYLTVMAWMTSILFILSIVLHRYFGGSLGKLAMGCRTRRSDGSPLGWPETITRSVVMFALGVMILAPGPLAAYVLGPGSEAWSSLLLIIGLVVWLWFVLFPISDSDSRQEKSLLERILGLETVKIRRPDTPNESSSR